MPSRPNPEPGGPDVLAVLVAHDGAAWLPRTLAALSASTVRPRRLVGVDTGSADGSRALLERACDDVVVLPASTGYPSAVAAAVARADAAGLRPRWLWLLHDDAAPAPDALAALLAHAAVDPSAVLLGAKARDWDDPRVLVEVGVTVDAAGHRETGLERGEQDQGQHDAVREVLAVGTAGALVRRDVWDRLGGLAEDLPLLRDDVDLGWRVNAAGGRVVVVPRAVVHHARAATTGRRRSGALRGASPQAVDRRHALLVRLAHAPAGLLPLLAVAMVLRGLLRSLGLLLGRQPRAGLAELQGTVGVLLRPGTLLRARRRRAATRALPASALRPLFASRRARLRTRGAALLDRLFGGAPVGAPDDLTVGPTADPDELPPEGDRLLRRPPVLLLLGLLVVALLAERSLLPGTGPYLAGGRLLPAPTGAGELWAGYARDGGPPVLAVLALLSTVLLGSARAAVDVVLLLSVPLAGLSAYLASGALVRSAALRTWAAAVWALLPVATGGLAQGRLETGVLQVVLPPLLLLGVRLLSRDPRQDRWRRAWGTGLLLTLVAAVSPTGGLLCAGLLLAGALLGRSAAAPALRDRAARRVAAAAVAVAVPAAVLLPVAGGLAVSAAEPVRALALAVLHPGGPGLPVAGLAVGVLLAALAGPVGRARRRTALLAWTAALAALTAAGLLARDALWPGPALQVAAAALLVAAVVAGDGLRGRLERAAFGVRQVGAGLLAVLAALTPLLLAGSWVVRGADGPLTRDPVPALPAFARAELAAQPGLRALVLQPDAGGLLRWTLVGPDGARLGDPARTRAEQARLAGLVADLATPSGSGAAEALSTAAVRYVALRGHADLATVLDAQPGLTRRASAPVPLWQVAAPTARLQVLPPAAAQAATGGAPGPDPDLLRAAPPLTVVRAVPAGPPGRLLVLAEPAGQGWRARLDGEPLPRRTAWGWAAGFALPPEGGRLVVAQEGGQRWAVLALQGVLLLVAAVLAAPVAAPRRDVEEVR